jgi:hypothetical protein
MTGEVNVNLFWVRGFTAESRTGPSVLGVAARLRPGTR